MSTTRTKPTPKKNYIVPRKELQDFELFYHHYLKRNGCTNIYPIANKYSSVDYFITSGMSSGDTSVVVEWKTRKEVSVTQYHTAIVEEKKLNKLLQVAADLTCFAYYFCEFNEAIVGWQIFPEKEYQVEVIPMPVSFTSSKIVDKRVIGLKFEDANIVVAKKNWTKSNAKQLMAFIYKEKIKYWQSVEGYYDPKDIEREVNYLNKKLSEL